MKKFLAIVLALTMILALSSSAFAADKKVTIRLASAFASTTGQVQGAEKFKELVEEKSGGNITVEVFADGTLGGEKESLEMLSIGEIDMMLSGTVCVATYAPEYAFFDCPFLFRDSEHFMNAWNGEIGLQCKDILEQNNIHYLDAVGRGYRYITSNLKLESVDDLQKITIRSAESTPYINTLNAIGCVVVPMALTELFTSLQLGVVDASEGPVEQIYGYKLYEVQDYVAMTGHCYSLACFLVNSDLYNGLSDEYKAIIDECAAEASIYGTQVCSELEEKLVEEMKAEGVEFYDFDVEPLNELAAPAIQDLFNTQWTVATYDEIAAY